MREAERAVGVALTMSEAAKACRVHRSTIRRHLFKQHFPNAYKESVNGWWRIPVADLEAAGLRPNRSGPAEERASAREEPAEDLERLRAELQEVQRRAYEAQMRAAAAEALAQERLERITDLRMAFRALQAGPARPAEASGGFFDEEAEAELEPERPAPIRREPGTYQRIPVKDLTPEEDDEKEPDLISLAIDAYKVFTPWRRRRH